MATDFGYTTFYQDFSIADRFGVDAIKDTFWGAFNEWKNNYIYLTKLVTALTWKIWDWYEKDENISRVYNNLWEIANEYAVNNLSGEELSYFYNTID